MKSRIVFVLSSVAAVSYLQAVPTNWPNGFKFGTTGIQAIPLSQGGSVDDMVFSSDYSSLWFESRYDGSAGTTYTGGIHMVGTPIRLFLGAENSSATNGKFQVFGYNGQFSTSSVPLFEIDSTTSKAKFDGVNLEVNNGTFKVGGVPVLTSAISSLAIGSGSTSPGTNSFAAGNLVSATGLYSSGFGYGTTAQGYTQFVVGQYNVVQGTSAANWNGSDPLFIVGNGYDANSRSNAFTVERSGTVRIAYSLAVGAGSTVSGTKSVAMGQSTATGDYSTALGNAYSIALCASSLGNSSAFANYSTAMGNSAAGAPFSTAMGNSIAQANYATAMGLGTNTQSYGSTVMGTYNLVAGWPTQWVAQDDLLIIGNGVDADHRSNALVVKKNGSLAVGTGMVIGTVPTGSSQVVVGAYNDTSTDNSTTPATVRANGVFAVGIGATAATRKNAVRVTTSGKLLIQPSGELAMGVFTSGEKP